MDQDVGLPERLGRGLRDGMDARPRAEVADDSGRAAAVRAESLDGLLDAGLAASDHDRRGTGPGECRGDAAADSGAAAGDDRSAALEREEGGEVIVHAVIRVVRSRCGVTTRVRR